MTRATRTLLALSLGTSLSLVAASARAQDAEATAAARRLLLTQAQQARDAGNHAAALDAADRAGRLQMTPSVRMFIAQEHLALGHLVAALGAASLCVSDAERDVNAPSRQVILDTCHALVNQLRPRVGMVTVRTPSPAPSGLQITVAGTALAEALYGVAYPVEPGSIVVDASAPGRVSFHRAVVVAAGQSVDVPLELAESPSAPTQSSPTAATPAASTTESTPSQPSLVGPAAVAAVGVVSFAAAGVFYYLRQDALSHCTLNATANTIDCVGDENFAAGQRAVTMNTATNVALGVGIVAVAAGAAWFAVGRLTSGGDSHAPRAMLHVAPVPGGALAGITGTF